MDLHVFMLTGCTIGSCQPFGNNRVIVIIMYDSSPLSLYELTCRLFCAIYDRITVFQKKLYFFILAITFPAVNQFN